MDEQQQGQAGALTVKRNRADPRSFDVFLGAELVGEIWRGGPSLWYVARADRRGTWSTSDYQAAKRLAERVLAKREATDG